VVLYRDDDAVSAYTDYVDGPLLFRSGGYWWDGAAWYRPAQVIDWPGEDYYRRPVPAAVTVTAADMLTSGAADPGRGTVVDVADIDPDAPYEGRWDDALALWAARRDNQGLDRCVVSLTAPELAAENLISAGDLAEITGIAPSTLRAYIARGEADVPLPQVIIGDRSLWARPVAEEWAEQRQRDPDAVEAAVSAPSHYGDPVPVGQAELAATLTRSFLAELWDYRPFRGRWALRWRTKDHVREVAAALGHEAASYMLRTLIPADALSATLQHALLDDLAESQRNDRPSPPAARSGSPARTTRQTRCRRTTASCPRSPRCSAGSPATAPPPPATSSPRSPAKPSADSASPATSPSRPSASPWTSTATWATPWTGSSPRL